MMTNQACISTVMPVTSIYVHTTDFGQHTGITMIDIPKPDYTLSLFVENVERELERSRSDHRTWTPVHGLYVSCLLTTCTH